MFVDIYMFSQNNTFIILKNDIHPYMNETQPPEFNKYLS